jgi:hypothetical protein
MILENDFQKSRENKACSLNKFLFSRTRINSLPLDVLKTKSLHFFMILSTHSSHDLPKSFFF